MSFKKTNEGRVFFQNSPGTANDGARREALPAQRQPQQISNTQVVELLRTLNDKLQASQVERKQMRQELQKYRALVEDMQSGIGQDPSGSGKAQRAEQIAAEALKELEEARRLILQIETKADRADQGISSLKAQMLETRQEKKLLVGKYTDFEQKLESTK